MPSSAACPTIDAQSASADESLFDLTGLSLELILVALDQVVESGAGLTPLGGARLRAGIAHALGGASAEPPASGSRDATADFGAGLGPNEVRDLRNSLAAVLCTAPIRF